MKDSLTSLAMKRPITVMMLVITLMGLGAISVRRMPIEFLPSIDMPFLGCYIPYPGATPAQVEQEIAIPAEGEFRTLPGIRNLYTNSNSGGCYVNINFQSGVDMTQSLAEIRDRIERLRLVLPQEVDRVFLRHFSSDSVPFMQLGLSREGDIEDFTYLVRTALQPKLERLDGVAQVEVQGAREGSILVEFDQNALRRHSLSIYQIIGMLQGSSLNLSIGELIDGDTKYFVRAVGEFTRPEEIAELIVAPGLQLKDVARVRRRVREERYHFAIDGHREVVLVITKESEANTVDVSRAVTKELNRVLATPAFAGVLQNDFFNQGDIITKALNGLLDAGKFGGAMALGVLFIFLLRIRPTVVVALAIPGSLLCGVVVLFFLGMSLNLVTMMSLIVAVGMVVDNSIVVVENIYRWRGLGFGPEESSRRGASEVALAITAATLTTAVVFVPVVFVDSGEMSIIMRQFAIPVTVALGASLVIALTVVPLAVSRFKDRGTRGRGLPGPLETAALPAPADASEGGLRRPSVILGGLRRGGGWLMAAFETCLRATMRWRLATVLVMAGLGVLTYFVPFRHLGMQAMPSTDDREVSIDVRFDQNYDFAMAQGVFEDIERIVDERREELGIKNVYSNYSARGGSLGLYLLQEDDLARGEELPLTTEDVMNVLWSILPSRIPGGWLRFESDESSVGGGGRSGGARVSMLLLGDDLDALNGYADQLITVMENLPNVSEAERNTRPPEQEIQLRIDEVLANRVGISATVVAQTVSFSLLGTRLPELKQDGREIPMWAQFSEEDRKSRANLDNVMIQGETGALVPLSQLVEYTRADSPQSIRRRNGKNYVWVSAKTAGQDIAQVMRDLKRVRDEFPLPPGYTVLLGDELRSMREDVSSFLSALLLAVILIYIVMSALFESWFFPLSIMTTVPLAFAGVFWMMYATDSSLDTIALIGCILMAGIVVNNGIVIVDRINNLRREGMNRFEAIIQAGKDRIRPVLMTALTTILGALPLALGGSAGAEAVTSLGRALIGGLAGGTVLTLFVVPLFYSFIDDFQIWCGQYLANLADLGRRGGAEGGAEG